MAYSADNMRLEDLVKWTAKEYPADCKDIVIKRRHEGNSFCAAYYGNGGEIIAGPVSSMFKLQKEMEKDLFARKLRACRGTLLSDTQPEQKVKTEMGMKHPDMVQPGKGE